MPGRETAKAKCRLYCKCPDRFSFFASGMPANHLILNWLQPMAAGLSSRASRRRLPLREDCVWRTPRAPASISIKRPAAKPVMLRRTSASGAFPGRARRFVLSSAIGKTSVGAVSQHDAAAEAQGRRRPQLRTSKRRRATLRRSKRNWRAVRFAEFFQTNFRHVLPRCPPEFLRRFSYSQVIEKIGAPETTKPPTFMLLN